MHLNVVADLSEVGHFSLTMSGPKIEWQEPEKLDLLKLLLSLQSGESSLPLFADQLQCNLEPFLRMILKKFYNIDDFESV